jgi:hypothetical protein
VRQAKLMDANKFSAAGFILGQSGFRQEVLSRFPIQERRMKSACQKRHHVFVIPGGLLAPGPHADPGCSVPAHEVDGDLAQDGQITGRCPVPDAAVILPERDIQDPMEPIFNRSVTADRLNQYGRVIAAA